MYLITLFKSVPKPLRYAAYLYFICLVVLELMVEFHSHLLKSTITQVGFATSFLGLIFCVVTITMVVNIQRWDNVVDATKGEIVRLYVQFRPESEHDSKVRLAKWELMTDSINEYIQKELKDIEPNYKKLFKFQIADIKLIFNEYMNYISNKVVMDYRTVDAKEIDIINPWDKMLLGVRNMYLEDLKLSFGDQVHDIDNFLFK